MAGETDAGKVNWAAFSSIQLPSAAHLMKELLGKCMLYTLLVSEIKNHYAFS